MHIKKLNPAALDFSEATEQAMHVRMLYQKLEECNHKGAWTTEEDMLAFTTDVGVLGRLVMAAEGRWVYHGDVHAELGSKLAECLWWIFVLSDRLDVDITEAFTSFIGKLNTDLAKQT
ncbi:nucleoside triphosphate pyrophosphohydrolase family protein [Pelosinus propionicus]|uniref:MazG-like protein n=1 Tax=Pelosinus propionicus DSM 13327 TaxID=1123291 RepID=A0A1I4HJN9_9FIRM|nr:hypothetical protein [Pelosinus propionicus]SFL42000.1 hypothetical protein SAMN04490355_100418 [Pelosinus propionicus DSM 13327]